MLEAMFVGSIRAVLLEGDDATPTPLEVAGWTRSFERERVIEAIHGGNDVEIKVIPAKKEGHLYLEMA